jgi:2,5-furandicarboxylate decarboxylase 1
MKARVNDLRSFIDLLRRNGAIRDITAQVDSVHELGAILHACEQDGKAAFFHNVKGSGIPVVGSALGSHERIALAVGCERDRLGDVLEAATQSPVPCREIAGPAPCQEVISDNVNLGMLPIPVHAPKDAGPFLNAGVVIGRDPLTGRHNLSYVRLQVKGPDRVGVNLNTWRHLLEFFETAEARGQNLPFCVAIGVDPALMIAAAFRYAGDEYEICGALRGEPTPVVRARTCDVLVPATAEIVLECEALAGIREDEGPMAEYTGHYSGVHRQPVGRINVITHRRDPIFQTTAGASFEHLLLGTAVTREPRLKRLAVDTSPRVREAYLPPYASGFLALIAMELPRPGEVRAVGIAAFSSHVNINTVVVVDTDVDIFNPTDVFWALATRVRWDRDMVVIPGTLGNELHPSADENGVISKVIIDATLAPELRGSYSKIVYPKVDLVALLAGQQQQAALAAERPAEKRPTRKADRQAHRQSVKRRKS